MLSGIFKNKLTLSGGLIVAILSVVAMFAPFLATHDPNQIDIDEFLMPPSKQHFLGTDQIGRDLYSRMVYGSRISLSVGFIAVGIATFIGLVLGSIAGFYGGRVDSLIMHFVDMCLCFPTFFLILAVIAILEPSIVNIMVIIGLTNWMSASRLVRAEILSLREREFIQAAKAIGVSNFRIISRHLIPNCLSVVLVSATLGVGGAILVESSLSFLGIGVQPPIPSWGNILTEAKSTLGFAWWLTLFPGIAILIAILGYNLLGEGLRDTLCRKE